jgi:hypothetical protein
VPILLGRSLPPQWDTGNGGVRTNHQTESDMNQLAAINYLVENGVGGSEWQEAGMWNAVCRVMRDADKQWTSAELDQLIEDAENN